MTEATEKHPTLSVVAPVFNEVNSIERFVATTYNVLDGLGMSFEIILVDDGSADGSGTLIQNLVLSIPQLRLISLSRNFGHQAAITAGVFEASGAAVVVMDSDLQDPPEVIPDLVDAWHCGADVAYAVRANRDGESTFKRTTASVFYRMLRSLSDIDIPADTGDFRLMSRHVVEALRELPERDRFMRGLVSWVGYTQVPVYFNRAERHAGSTKYSLGRMLRLGTSGIVGFSDKPLYVTILAGVIVLVLALLGLGYIVLSLLMDWGNLVRGWASVMVVVMFFSAVQLIFLGVLGAYVSRIFVEVKRRPLYVIRANRES